MDGKAQKLGTKRLLDMLGVCRIELVLLRKPPLRPFGSGSMVPVSDFSGLASSVCALARAVASAAIEGLDRGVAFPPRSLSPEGRS
jgi:hypothetical protein